MKTVIIMAIILRYNSMEMGFKPFNAKEHYTPFSSGSMIAHDLIEHGYGIDSIGTIEDELMAVGAAVGVRMQFGVITDSGVAGDLITVYDYWKGRKLKVPKTHQHDLDEDFDHIINEFVKRIAEYIEPNKPVDMFVKACKHLMRKGARRCVQRFGSFEAANKAFYNLEQEFSEKTKYIDDFQAVKITFYDGLYRVKNIGFNAH